ncbi:ubiquitin carboxyl-terminal hydrolase 47-like isoform X2 [Ornithodoros turicata]|uniref:ubiquitin carboxyl-terminal hydrolase 47-like isoform X2 n=1 Tax=Ornithodoros turicata TaxID=34597 RepID=UPI003139AC52
MVPGENTHPVPAEVPTTAVEPQATCVVQDMRNEQLNRKVTLSLPCSTTGLELMHAVSEKFSYSPDSSELVFQRWRLPQRPKDGDKEGSVDVRLHKEQTLEDMGFQCHSMIQNMLAIYDRNREPPKELTVPTTVEEAQATCIVRDMTTGQMHSPKVTLSLPSSTTALELMHAVSEKFNYSPDSFELLFQRLKDGDSVAVHLHTEQTLEDMGFQCDSITRNILVIYDRNREPPKKLMAPPPQEEIESEEMPPAAEWGHRRPLCDNKRPLKDDKYVNTHYKEVGYVGLVNQAMTCYLNSLLQTLYMTPEFRNALYRWEFDGTDEDGVKSIPFQLQKLFLLLQTSSKPAIGTTDLTTSFGWDSSEAWQQHDVQELCRVMFDALEHKFKNTDQAKLICQLYEGKLKDYVKCLECGNESAREDTFLDIPLVVRPFGSSQAYGSVEEALCAFVTPETLEGSNQYFCERCGKKCDAHKGLKFIKFPYLLTLQLKRFDFDPVTMHRIKLNDKVTFPEILNLNQFIKTESEQQDVGAGDDADTTDSGSALDDDSLACSSGAKPSPTERPCDESDDEGIDVDGNSDGPANNRFIRRPNEKGPYVYELFSIMVHSGSANGGHYYAYVKSFRDNQWFCFNDAQVSGVTYDEIRKTYGGGPGRSGYYFSAYSSSTNAYMLMYRQIDKEHNAAAMVPEEFPQHIKDLLRRMEEAEEHERQQREIERSKCRIKLFCAHPLKHTMKEMKLKVDKDTSLQETTETAHKIMGLQGVVPLECCRLVMYDDCAESLECSFEDCEDQPIGEILGGVKSTYQFDLLLEIRKPHETFQAYKPGGTTVKVYNVILEREDIGQATIVRGLKSQTVEEFKAQVATQLGLPSPNMRMVVERYHNDLFFLSSPEKTLKSEGFGKSNTVYIECYDEDDAKKEFRDSHFFEILDRQMHTIMVHVDLPSADQVAQERHHVPAPKEPRPWNVDDDSGTLARTQAQAAGTSDDYDSDLCDSSSSGCQGGGGDQSEDSSLTDSERTLVGDDISPRNNSPDFVLDRETELSQLGPSGPPNDISKNLEEELHNPSSKEDARVLDNTTAFNGGDDYVPVEALPKEEPRRYFRARPYTDPEDNSRQLRVFVDKRITFGGLKKELEPYVGVSADYFKVFRIYSNNQEFECTKLTDNMISYTNDEKFEIKLGRALRSGEHRLKIYLLTPTAAEPSKFLLDWIIPKGAPVQQVKKEILPEIKERCQLDIPLNRCRLRKKTSTNPGAVYLNSGKFDEDVPTFLSYEVFLEVLPGPDKVISSSNMALFVRRWRPSTFTFDPLDELVLEQRTFNCLKETLSTHSGIEKDNLEVAKCPGPFPCTVSSLTVNTETEWHGTATSLCSWPLYINEDGLVVLYRDKTEPVRELTEEEKREITNRETARMSRSMMTVPSPRKEKALKIYVGSPPSTSTLSQNPSNSVQSQTQSAHHAVPLDLD